MQSSTDAVAPADRYARFLQQSRRIQADRLAEAIPKHLFVTRTWRGLLGFAVSYALYIGAIVGIAFVPHRAWAIPLYVVAGLGGWGLHCIAHDCGHNSFSRSRPLNVLIGHLSLLPLLYPFFAWKHVHNLHHFNTNNVELDTDWRPIPKGMYERMSRWQRLVYIGTRTWAFWAGTINYWWVSGFRPSFFPKKDMRRDVWRSMGVVGAIAALYVAWLVHVAGWTGFALYFVLPWIAIHAWFSVTTLMHHTADDIPFMTAKDWTANASRMLVTTDYRYPAWLLFLTHNISIHTAHHVAPVVPFYNLPAAQQALKAAYPGMIREKPFRFGDLWRILRDCRFYDPQSSYYSDGSDPIAAVGGRRAGA